MFQSTTKILKLLRSFVLVSGYKKKSECELKKALFFSRILNFPKIKSCEH